MQKLYRLGERNALLPPASHHQSYVLVLSIGLVLPSIASSNPLALHQPSFHSSPLLYHYLQSPCFTSALLSLSSSPPSLPPIPLLHLSLRFTLLHRYLKSPCSTPPRPSNSSSPPALHFIRLFQKPPTLQRPPSLHSLSGVSALSPHLSRRRNRQQAVAGPRHMTLQGKKSVSSCAQPAITQPTPRSTQESFLFQTDTLGFRARSPSPFRPAKSSVCRGTQT